MYKERIDILKLNGVEFAEGLSEQEIIEIKQEYNIDFPKELQELYSTALPVSKGFYNWRDLRPANVQYIKDVMKIPFNDIYELADEVYWCDEWGEEPNESERVEVVRTMLKKAPALIPIYSHRYIPSINLEPTPVFSIHDTDVIYYSENIESYFETEFGIKDHSDISYDIIKHVPFWSDLL
ncbi:hypothetical protein [Anaeromicropila herbilytica]|uniref:SMI1/KNR4 family protein n=1 Tax=Anaeromicropila herbilytica TaxID=2785025 RepID=A0A7R7EHW2_9FIRM|nr:hypothetical protein [Anaeromicropila herbilytica]BCN29040.1 hypothetical protein bsdtb5_03350 [Anaeromicropila herbilytica]